MADLGRGDILSRLAGRGEAEFLCGDLPAAALWGGAPGGPGVPGGPPGAAPAGGVAALLARAVVGEGEGGGCDEEDCWL